MHGKLPEESEWACPLWRACRLCSIFGLSGGSGAFNTPGLGLWLGPREDGPRAERQFFLERGTPLVPEILLESTELAVCLICRPLGTPSRLTPLHVVV